MTDPTTPELILVRFCGREVHPIIKATWNLYRDDELEQMTLCLQMEAGVGTTLGEDTQQLAAEPSWELNFIKPELSDASLTAGAELAMPEGYDESQGGYLTNVYYCEHEPSDKNKMMILARDGTRLLIRVEGETIDVNYYDGSKDPTKLLVESWFEHDASTRRSLA